jgi:poly-beta-1,6-N-acetyl-D-glucosamine synthase
MGALTAIAAAALGVVAYTYVGYPIVIGLLARLRPHDRPAAPPAWREGDDAPMVTACIAAHDAAAHIGRKIESLLAQTYPQDRLEIIVYSDASTDDTDAIVERLGELSGGRVRLMRGEDRAGKPTALNLMRAEARGEVLLMTDARQPLAPGALRALVARLAPPEVGCVSGNLVLEGAAGAGAYWRYEKWIRRQEARYRSLLGVTGAVYVIRAADLPPLPPELILDDMWIPMRLRLEGREIAWCEEAEAYDQAFDDDREFHRKARTLAGNFQLFTLLPGLLDPRANPSWFETVSHKALRLACPAALGALLASSAGIAYGAAWGLIGATPLGTLRLARLLLAGQGLFYALAAAGPAVGKAGRLARTFVVMNAAAAAGALRWARGAQSVTW